MQIYVSKLICTTKIQRTFEDEKLMRHSTKRGVNSGWQSVKETNFNTVAKSDIDKVTQ